MTELFPPEEYHLRLKALRQSMARTGLDALLLTTPADIFYVTGFLTRFWESPARAWYVVIPAQGAPIAVIPDIGAALMRRTWPHDIRTWPAPQPKDDGISLLADTLAQVTRPLGRIGLPMGAESHVRMPLEDFQALSLRLSPRALVPDGGAVREVREIKSRREIDKIIATCTIAGRAFDRVPEIAAAGRPLSQVFRRFQAALLEEGADWVSYVAGGAGPDGYEDVIAPASDARLTRGDVLMLDTGAVRDGYFCDFDRNFAIGPASDAARRAHHSLWQATETALAQIRPGLRACDMHGILAQALGPKAGAGRLGHGLGLSLTEWPSFAPQDETELRAGMVLTIEPSLEVAPGRIMVHEENILLRETGAVLLSPRTPPDLPEITG